MMQKGERYPCTENWYEMQYACTDDMIEYLLELGHVRMVNNYHPKDYMSHDVKIRPSIFDMPEQGTERRAYTY